MKQSKHLLAVIAGQSSVVAILVLDDRLFAGLALFAFGALVISTIDTVLRAVLGDRRVRIALSEAIDRPRIIANLFAGEAVPWQVAPRPGSPYHLMETMED